MSTASAVMLKKAYVLDSSSPGTDDRDLTLVAFAVLLSDVFIMNTVTQLNLFMLQVLSQAAQIAQSIWKRVQPDRTPKFPTFIWTVGEVAANPVIGDNPW